MSQNAKTVEKTLQYKILIIMMIIIIVIIIIIIIIIVQRPYTDSDMNTNPLETV